MDGRSSAMEAFLQNGALLLNTLQLLQFRDVICCRRVSRSFHTFIESNESRLRQKFDDRTVFLFKNGSHILSLHGPKPSRSGLVFDISSSSSHGLSFTPHTELTLRCGKCVMLSTNEKNEELLVKELISKISTRFIIHQVSLPSLWHFAKEAIAELPDLEKLCLFSFYNPAREKLKEVLELRSPIKSLEIDSRFCGRLLSSCFSSPAFRALETFKCPVMGERSTIEFDDETLLSMPNLHSLDLGRAKNAITPLGVGQILDQHVQGKRTIREISVVIEGTIFDENDIYRHRCHSQCVYFGFHKIVSASNPISLFMKVSRDSPNSWLVSIFSHQSL